MMELASEAQADATPALTVRDVKVAGTWRRLGAMIIDTSAWLGLSVLITPLVVDTPPQRWNLIDHTIDLINQQPALIIAIVAVTMGIMFTWYLLGDLVLGASLGKRLWGLRVIGATGSRPSKLANILHGLLRVCSWLSAGIGHLWAIVDRERRTLYDRGSRTYTILNARRKAP